MTKPTIHMNGTSAESLLEGYRNAMEGISNAQQAMRSAWPNGRDYYPQGPDAINVAIREHAVRLQKLDEIHAELLELAVHCDAIITEREARRAERNKP
jgi:hypothetical protein